MEKRARICLLLVAVLLLACACGQGRQPSFRFQPAYPGAKILRARQAQQDADELIAAIEQNHPAFFLDRVPPLYHARKEDLLAAVQQDTTVGAFAHAAQRMLAGLRDGHTTTYLLSGSMLLDVPLRYADGRLYVPDDPGGAGGAAVLRIGGVPVTDILARIDELVPMENEAHSAIGYAQYAGHKQLLELCGVDVGAKVPIVLGSATGEETVQAAFQAAAEATAHPSITWEMRGDVFYARMYACVLDAALEETAAALRAAVAGGTTRVIIDVRGNGGGNSGACDALLAAMDMVPPAFGVYTPASPYFLETRVSDANHPYVQALLANGYQYEAPGLACAQQNEAISLVVLTDEASYSSAMMLAVYVQDGGLGTVIGRPSGNSPSSYGDVWYFQLRHSRVAGQVSLKYWERPDTAADQTCVYPDIITGAGEDALEAALAFLGG